MEITGKITREDCEKYSYIVITMTDRQDYERMKTIVTDWGFTPTNVPTEFTKTWEFFLHHNGHAYFIDNPGTKKDFKTIVIPSSRFTITADENGNYW